MTTKNAINIRVKNPSEQDVLFSKLERAGVKGAFVYDWSMSSAKVSVPDTKENRRILKTFPGLTKR